MKLKHLICFIPFLILFSCAKDEDQIIDDLILWQLKNLKGDLITRNRSNNLPDKIIPIIKTFEKEIINRKGLPNTIIALDSALTELNFLDNDEKQNIDSILNIVRDKSQSLSLRKYNSIIVINYLLFYKTSIVFGHNYQVKLLNVDTIYLPANRDFEFYYMLINPKEDTIRSQDVFYSSAFGHKKSIRLNVKGEQGEVIQKEVKLPITNPITNEIRYYNDSIRIKIVND